MGGIGLRGHQVGPAVLRMLIEDVLPHPQGSVDVAVDPSLERIDVRPFAPCVARGQAPGSCQRIAGGRQVRCIEPQHLEIALENMGKAELRIGGEQGPKPARAVGAVLQVAEHGMIERLRCMRRRRR